MSNADEIKILGVPRFMYLRMPSLGIVFSLQEYRGKLYFDARYYRLRNLTKNVKKWCPTPKGYRVEVGEVVALLDVMAAFMENELSLKVEVSE